MKTKEIDLFEVNEGSLATENPFKDRTIAFVGQFKNKNIKTDIKRLGGNIQDGDVTKGCHFLVKGINCADKLSKYRRLVFNGFNIQLITEDEANSIIVGDSLGICVPKEIKKNLHLTIAHYEESVINLKTPYRSEDGELHVLNNIYGNSMYLGEYIKCDKRTLRQLLGFIGVFGSAGLDDKTDIIVVSEEALDALKAGKNHPELEKIETTYNGGVSNIFSYKFLSESSLYDWLKTRAEVCGDMQAISMLRML